MNQAGTYNANLTRGVLSKAGNGSMQFVVVFNVTHYSADGQWIEISPFERSVYLSMSGGAKPYTQKKLATIGFTDPSQLAKDESSGEMLLVVSDEVYKRPLQLICKRGTKQDGSEREEWDFSNWSGGNTGNPAGDEDVLKLSTIWD